MTDRIVFVSRDGQQAIRALGNIDRSVKKDIKTILRVGMKAIRVLAVSNMQGRSGGGTYPRRAGMITTRAQGIVLNAGSTYPWAFGAEFGAERAWVFGRVTSQSKLAKRQFAPWGTNRMRLRGRSFQGWLIAPAMVEADPFISNGILRQIEELIREANNRAGVPR